MKITIDFSNRKNTDFIICTREFSSQRFMDTILYEVVGWVADSRHFPGRGIRVRYPDWHFMYTLSTSLRAKLEFGTLCRWRDYFIKNSLPSKEDHRRL